MKLVYFCLYVNNLGRMEFTMNKRVIWLILDSAGIGELEDASEFGDKGADTFGHIYEYMKQKGEFSLPNLEQMGLGNIDSVNNSIPKTEEPVAVYCKAKEVSKGKDTTIGHWEMCGIITENPFPVYPDGFPKEIIDEFIRRTGIPGVLGNKVASGTEIIKELGTEHFNSKKPIVYTSADSVFQIACHEDIYSNEELYRMCETAREILTGNDAVARVIARPFKGKSDNYNRTPARRDFSLKPNKQNLLYFLKKSGINVNAVGKIEDIFAGVGITNAVHTKDNMDGMDKTLQYMNQYKNGLIFTNLVEYDSKWGHRRDVEGYATGLKDFDRRLPEIVREMTEDDILIINADHGCDPTFQGTDHTREYVPVLIYGKKIKSFNAGIRESFADIGATVASYLGIEMKQGKNILL